jgi:hypothetical protein
MILAADRGEIDALWQTGGNQKSGGLGDLLGRRQTSKGGL